MSDMIEVKTTHLTGLALNYAVGIADGRELELPCTSIGRQYVAWCDPFVVKRDGKPDFHDKTRRRWEPSSDWSQGGQLIEAHAITLAPYSMDLGGLPHYWVAEPWGECPLPIDGDTPLIAACRAVVAAKLGEIVKVPAELVKP